MKLIPIEEYEAWLAVGGIVRDVRLGDQGSLEFRDLPSDLWRAWETPQSASDLPGFVSTLMSAAAPSGPFILRPRGAAPWYTGTEYGEGPLPEQIRDRIVGTLAIPKDFDGALEFAKAEWRDVQMLMLTFLVYGWNIADDLEVVSGDRSCLLMTSHHGHVAVHCRDVARLAAFQTEMAANRYPAAGDAPVPTIDAAG